MLLKDYVPFFISKTREMNCIYNAQEREINKLNLDVKDLVKQCFVNTATWGLKIWEQFVGINTDTSKSIEERRVNILAKLRGQGTTTKKVIEEIAQSYADKAKVTEYNKESYFIVGLESINKGYPFSLDGLFQAIEAIQPAHLESRYNLKSTTKDKLRFAAITRSAETITVYPWTPKETHVQGKIYISTSNNRTLETTTIYPKGGN
ncbi:DUF2313 domain-containing protein [Clostridium botulinum]|nr:DUF2313 domain-containing protein [Clostridium botulinum]